MGRLAHYHHRFDPFTFECLFWQVCYGRFLLWIEHNLAVCICIHGGWSATNPTSNEESDRLHASVKFIRCVCDHGCLSHIFKYPRHNIQSFKELRLDLVQDNRDHNEHYYFYLPSFAHCYTELVGGESEQF